MARASGGVSGDRRPGFFAFRLIGTGLRFVLVSLLVAAFAGCQRISIETNPIGRKIYRVDTPETAERVNGWPILYHQGDATSVLWPFLQKTKDGHAVFPFYTYDGRDKILWLFEGLIGHFNYGKRRYYIGNVIVDRKNQWFTVLPLYFQDYGPLPKLMLLPLFYWEMGARGRPSSFISLPFSKGEDFVNVLGPIFNRYFDARKTRTDILFPLVEVERAKDGSQVANTVLPLWYYDRSGPADAPINRMIIAGLIAYVSKWKPDSSYRSVLFPLTHFWRNKDSRGSALLPVFFHQKTAAGEDRCLIPPIWMAKGPASFVFNLGLATVLISREEQESHESFLYLAHFWNTARSMGHMVLPAYSWRRYAGGGHMFNSFLYNQSERGDSRMVNAGGPLFTATEKGDGRYRTVLWPLYQGWRSPRERSDLLFPLFYRKAGQEKSVLATPFFYRAADGESSYLNVGGILFNRKKDAQGEWTVTPLYSAGRNGEGGKFLNAFGPLFFHHSSPKAWLTAVTPLFWAGRKGHESGSLLFPLYFFNRTKTSLGFYSLPFSRAREGGKHWWTFLLLLAEHDVEPGSRSYRFLGPFTGFTRSATKGTTAWAFPLFRADRHGFLTLPVGYHNDLPPKEKRDLWLEAEKVGSPGRTHFWHSRYWHFLLILNSDTTLRCVYPKAGDETASASMTLTHHFNLFPLYSGESTEGDAAHSAGLFGIVWKGDSQVVTNLDRRDTHVHNRVLWKIVDYESLGAARSMDVFPFMTFDRDTGKQYRRFSFLGPVVSFARLGQKTETRVCGFRMGDRIEYTRAK